ncbi:MAG: ATP-binding cassette domain-containing protein [Actinobacteria bacterium]|nr:ATP-binding cassette domain-containing protein [Actinomycetota bacterium]
MLSLTGIFVNYGHVAAVRGVSLEVNEGEVVGLIGPNGAGKTTLLSAIAGVIRPERGDIQLLGETLLGKAPEKIVPMGISLVPEGREIFGTLTVEENLRLGATIRRRDPEVAGDIESMMERFPILGKYRGTHAGALSGGEQQQLAIARALLANPKLLLLDEPSLGLAPKLVDQVFDIVGQLKEDGVTVLLVEQNARRTLEFADRTYVLRSGEIRLSGTKKELSSMDNADFEHAFLGFHRGERQGESR